MNLSKMSLADLKLMAKESGLKGITGMKKADLLAKMVEFAELNNIKSWGMTDEVAEEEKTGTAESVDTQKNDSNFVGASESTDESKGSFVGASESAAEATTSNDVASSASQAGSSAGVPYYGNPGSSVRYRTYSSDNNNGQRVYRPRTGSDTTRTYRPRNNYDNQGSYRQNNNYSNQGNYSNQNGYRQYSNQGGYRQNNYDNQGSYRQNNYDNQSGYRQNNYDNQGGYRTNNYDSQGGYRINNYDKQNNYDNQSGYRTNNYDNQGGYRQNNYDNQGGYRQNSYDNQSSYSQNSSYDNQTGYRQNAGYDMQNIYPSSENGASQIEAENQVVYKNDSGTEITYGTENGSRRISYRRSTGAGSSAASASTVPAASAVSPASASASAVMTSTAAKTDLDSTASFENSKEESAVNETFKDQQEEAKTFERPAFDSGISREGVLEIVKSEGFGFIRCDNYLPGIDDVYVSPAQIRRFNLKTGDYIKGTLKIKNPLEKYQGIAIIEEINGGSPEDAVKRPKFENLTPVFPHERIHFETPYCTPAMRIVDLLSPVGKGQRGMIVSPPKAGKTTLLKQMANAITINHPEMKLIILLIDERPEEVTDIKESITGNQVEVIYSTFDELPDNHKRVSEMVIERAKRLVEHGKDVCILLDSITRLSRAYNLTVTNSGRTLSGGLDPSALYMPKKFFGAARCMREGGSLTILATALVDTGSRMDDVVFEEFKGTGNMELVLDRSLSERRIFPAMDIQKSGTRRDDLLLSKEEFEATNTMRSALNSARSREAIEIILNYFKGTRNNQELIKNIKMSGILPKYPQ